MTDVVTPVLSSEEVQTLLTTWDELRGKEPDMDGFCLAVVVRYLEKNPNMKYVFEAGKTKTLEEMKTDTSFTKHGEMLHSSLDQVVRHLTAGGQQPAELRTLLKDLGQKHVVLGIRTPQYKPVGAELLSGMKEKLGLTFTPEIEAVWAKAYGLIVELMNVDEKVPKAPAPSETGTTTTEVPPQAAT